MRCLKTAANVSDHEALDNVYFTINLCISIRIILCLSSIGYNSINFKSCTISLFNHWSEYVRMINYIVCLCEGGVGRLIGLISACGALNTPCHLVNCWSIAVQTHDFLVVRMFSRGIVNKGSRISRSFSSARVLRADFTHAVSTLPNVVTRTLESPTHASVSID